MKIRRIDFDLAADVSGVALNCQVNRSVVTYVTAEFDATDVSNTDNSDNIGWNFGATIGDAFYLAPPGVVPEISDVTYAIRLQVSNP